MIVVLSIGFVVLLLLWSFLAWDVYEQRRRIRRIEKHLELPHFESMSEKIRQVVQSDESH